MTQYYDQCAARFRELFHLQHCSAMLHWDEAVMMPEGGTHARAEALSTLSGIMHDKTSDPLLGEWLSNVVVESLNPWQQANVQWMKKIYDDATLLPKKLVQAKTMATIQCESAWRRLRAENNWHDFLPLLDHTFQLVKEAAQIRAEKYGKTPYAVLLDDYNPGMTTDYIDPIFAKLRDFLPAFIQEIVIKQKSESVISLEGHYAIEKQKAYGLQLMQIIGFNFSHGRLDTSHHPFCGGVPEDVRITTRYNEKEFISAAMGVCHETGHALYEQQLPKAWIEQPVGAALGMAVHESQSLLMEMQVCLSRAFMPSMITAAKNVFGDHAGLTQDNLHRHYTRVKPGFIRVDADEVTYPLHVILRYEIEKALFSGDITVADLPAIWNEKMQKYLGLSTLGNDKDGVMQDVHWPSGAFGYFPAYTLGALIAAQLYDHVKKAIPTIVESISRGEFSELKNWLRENIHQRASSVPVSTLLQDATGEGLNADYFINHLNRRYKIGE